MPSIRQSSANILDRLGCTRLSCLRFLSHLHSPTGYYDEPEILSYAIPLICSIGVDGEQWLHPEAPATLRYGQLTGCRTEAQKRKNRFFLILKSVVGGLSGQILMSFQLKMDIEMCSSTRKIFHVVRYNAIFPFCPME